MERLLLLLLLVLGVGGAQPGARHYDLVREEKNWTDAQIYCREHYSDLATVDDFDDIRRINQNLSDIDVPWMWIGLHRDKQNKTVFRWSDGSKSSFLYWAPLEPNNMDEGCVEAKFQGSLNESTTNWNDKSCENERPFLCYMNEPHLCSSQEVTLLTLNKTWEEAVEYCRYHHHDLVSVHNEKMQNCVHHAAKNATTAFIWLGLHYTCVLEFWFWVNYEAYGFTCWEPGHGQERGGECDMSAAMQTGGGHKWFSKPITEKFNFICSNH